MTDPGWSREWLEYAQHDYAAAQHLLSLYPVPVEIICFHCQQTAEKALKGILIANGTEPPKMHDLVPLCRQCAEFDSGFQELERLCSELTLYGVQPRYPSGMEVDESDMKRALAGAKQVLDLAEQFMTQAQMSSDGPTAEQRML